jgi:hypothetical protein
MGEGEIKDNKLYKRFLVGCPGEVFFLAGWLADLLDLSDDGCSESVRLVGPVDLPSGY